MRLQLLGGKDILLGRILSGFAMPNWSRFWHGYRSSARQNYGSCHTSHICCVGKLRNSQRQSCVAVKNGTGVTLTENLKIEKVE